MLTFLAICGFNVVYSMKNVGLLTIKQEGEDITRYVLSHDASGVSATGNSITIPNNDRATIGETISQPQPNNWGPDIFSVFFLKGKTLKFTSDISQIGCSCNTGMFLMSGTVDPGKYGNYHCDATMINGEFCWEMEIMEANRFAMQSTAHTCDQLPGKDSKISQCDHNGCGTNVYDLNTEAVCPFPHCIIDTSQPFDTSITFGEEYHVLLEQNGRRFEYDACENAAYVKNMDHALDFGMNLVFSSWGGGDGKDMKWLDGKTGCPGQCEGTNAGTSTFSNFQIY